MVVGSSVDFRFYEYISCIARIFMKYIAILWGFLALVHVCSMVTLYSEVVLSLSR